MVLRARKRPPQAATQPSRSRIVPICWLFRRAFRHGRLPSGTSSGALIPAFETPRKKEVANFAGRVTSVRSSFQSTQPVRAATILAHHPVVLEHVSIHAARAGRDWASAADYVAVAGFNPRSPCGPRRELAASERSNLAGFQSTQPVRAATVTCLPYGPSGQVSIHAARAGRDLTHFHSWVDHLSFQSTQPVRAATAVAFSHRHVSRFQSTQPVRAATARRVPRDRAADCFNPRSPCGPRRRRRALAPGPNCFNPRSPCGPRRSR